MKKNHIYTRTGDQGLTSLASGERVEKGSVRLESYGTIDELNAHVGLLRSMIGQEEICRQLLRIQNRLFQVGCLLATAEGKKVMEGLEEKDAHELEGWMDSMNERIPPMKGFVLPGGCQAAAQSHVCRTVCRRAERIICQLAQESQVDAHLKIYVNRLSDYFFILSLYLKLMDGKKEISWKDVKE